MKLYRVQLTLSSPLVTPLKGDTIWGHIVWGIANHEEDVAVAQFLQDCAADEPAFAVSTAFPHGYICRQLHEVQKREEILTSESYAALKRLKKALYEAAATYLAVSAPDVAHDSAFVQNTVSHNSISRISGTVEENGLYAQMELCPKTKEFDLYIAASYPPGRCMELCKWAFENGYGADASTGKGVITVSDDIQEVAAKYAGNRYMALAPFALADMNTISDLRADLFVRNGKIGGAFAGTLTPWKKTVVLYNEGAVFTAESGLHSVGMLLKNIHADGRICQCAFAPVIPIA